MRKTFFLTLILLAAMVVPVHAGKIGYIDSLTLASESDAAQAAGAKMKAEFGPENQELEALAADYQKKLQELEVQAAALSQTAREDRKLELVRMRRDVEDRQRALSRKVQAANESVRRSISALILKAVDTFAKKNQYDIVFDKSYPSMVYAVPGLDVTKEVMVEVNRLYRESKK